MPTSDPVSRSHRVTPAVLMLALLAGITAAGQGAGVHPVSGRQFALPMSVDGAPWLTRAEREREEAPDLALKLLAIASGSTVADVGAGAGYMTLKLAKIVGPTGRVYANDLQAGMLALLQKNVAREKVSNVTPVLGTIDDPKLPSGARRNSAVAALRRPAASPSRTAIAWSARRSSKDNPGAGASSTSF